MGWWLAGEADAIKAQKRAGGWIKRFDPRFWTVNFPRPMMAAVTTTAPDALRVDSVFYRSDDPPYYLEPIVTAGDHVLHRGGNPTGYREHPVRHSEIEHIVPDNGGGPPPNRRCNRCQFHVPGSPAMDADHCLVRSARYVVVQ